MIAREKSPKPEPKTLCAAVFALCLLARFIEYFIIGTDKTVIGENVLHKIFGIILLAAILKYTKLKWSDIGFRRNGFISGVFRGFLLGSVCFAAAYTAELAVLTAKGSPAHLELYVSGFSLNGSQTKNTDILFLTLCAAVNIVNVWMEEGIFRGLFIKVLSDTKAFMRANSIAAALFGVWHIVMPIRSFIDGEMTLAEAIFMGAGYIILSGIMGIKWGILYRITGNLWAGLGDHLLNNTLATNLLHVVCANGADELQILRVVLAQIVSFVGVMMVYRRRFSDR